MLKIKEKTALEGLDLNYFRRENCLKVKEIEFQLFINSMQNFY